MNLRTAAFVLLSSLAACGPNDATAIDAPDTLSDDGSAITAPVPSEDRPETVDAISWNVEWFGDTVNGPTSETLQQTNVARALSQLDADLFGLVEVVSPEAFAAVLAKMPGHDGILSNDPRVTDGATFYSAKEQKVALVFKKRFKVESARLVVTQSQFAFGGRPPMEVKLSFSEGGRPRTLVVLVTHFKAMADADGYARRTQAAAALKTFLDTEYPSKWVLVMGDFNDDLVNSTFHGSPSPLAALATDPGYRFTTEALSAGHLSTTVHFASTIDHHLVTNELAARYVDGSAKVIRLDGFFSRYGTTTSDHYPVLTRYDLR
jgi:endonuclease/exonuclease/phosphatase family metal-dependent hydrolase